MKIINGVKWYSTTEKTPGDNDCEIILIHQKDSDGDSFRSIIITDWNARKKGIFCLSYAVASTPITKYLYWCYADDFFDSFAKNGMDATSTYTI